MNIEQYRYHSGDDLRWGKSSYSGTSGGNCVEVAVSPSGVHVRDSKDTAGPSLVFEAQAWADFVGFAAALGA